MSGSIDGCCSYNESEIYLRFCTQIRFPENAFHGVLNAQKQFRSYYFSDLNQVVISTIATNALSVPPSSGCRFFLVHLRLLLASIRCTGTCRRYHPCQSKPRGELPAPLRLPLLLNSLQLAPRCLVPPLNRPTSPATVQRPRSNLQRRNLSISSKRKLQKASLAIGK